MTPGQNGRSQGTPRVHVGQFTFDQHTLELFEGDRPVPLQPKPTLVLAELIAARGALVDRARLYQAAWGDTVVEFDVALNRCIRDIRAAVRDDAKAPWFVETVPRRGYRMVVPVTAVEPMARREPLRRPALLGVAAILLLLGVSLPFAIRNSARSHSDTILTFRSFGTEVAGIDGAVRDDVYRRLRLGTNGAQSTGLLVNGVIVSAPEGALLQVTILRVADGQTLWSGQYNPLCERIVGDPIEVIGSLISREVLARS